MKVGDSIFVAKSPPQASSISSHILGKGNYACRAEKTGTRIWRIK
jgi:hypothetical protein